MSVHDIGGEEVTLSLPDGAHVTGALMIATYQCMEGDDVRAGVVWGYSNIPHVQAVGMLRVASNAVESITYE